MNTYSGLLPPLTVKTDTRASSLIEAPNGLVPPSHRALEGNAEPKGGAKGLSAVEEKDGYDLGQESTRGSSLGPTDEADTICTTSADMAFPLKFEERSSLHHESEQRTSCPEQKLTLDCTASEDPFEEKKVPKINSTPLNLQRCAHHEGCGRSSHKSDPRGSSNCLLQLLKATSARELEEEIKWCESHQRASDPICTNTDEEKDHRGTSKTEEATAALEDEKHHHWRAHHHHHKASGDRSHSASDARDNHHRCKKRRFLKIINAAISVVPSFAAVAGVEHHSTDQRGAQEASEAAAAAPFVTDNSLGDDLTRTDEIQNTKNNADRKKSSSSSTHWLAGRAGEDFTVRTLSGGLTNQLYLVRHTPSQHAVVVRRYGKQTGKIISRESEQFWQSVFLKTYGRVGGHMLVYEFLDGHKTLTGEGEGEDAEVPPTPISTSNSTCNDNDTARHLVSRRSVLAQWAGPIARRLAEMHCRATSVAVFRRTPQTGLAGIGASGIWAMEAGAAATAVAHGLDPANAVPVLTPRRVSASLGRSFVVSGLAVSSGGDRCSAHTTTNSIITTTTTANTTFMNAAAVVAADEPPLLRSISQQDSASSQGLAPLVKPKHFHQRQLSHLQQPYLPPLPQPSPVAQTMLAAERIGAVNHTIATLTEWVDRVFDLQKVRKGIASNAGSEERGRLRVALFDEGLAWHVGVGGKAAVVVGDDRVAYSPTPSTVSQQPAIGANLNDESPQEDSGYGEESSCVAPLDGRPSDDSGGGEKHPSSPQEVLRTPLTCTNLTTENTSTSVATQTPLYDFPTRLLQERDWLLSVIQHNAPKLTTAVCHNDLVGGNIMVKLREKYAKQLARRTMSVPVGANAAVLPPEEAFPKDLKHYDLQFIDFEYMRRNYVYFDIANHFNEYAGLDLRFDEYFPTREEAKAFIREYLTHGRAVVEAMQRTMEALSTENYSVSPSSQEDEEEGEEEKCNANTNQQSKAAHPDGASSLSSQTFVTDEEVEEATDLVFFFTLVSHFIWVVWSIIQELNSDIDFDYLEYAVIRWRRYLSTREAFSYPVTRGMSLEEASPTMEAGVVVT